MSGFLPPRSNGSYAPPVFNGGKLQPSHGTRARPTAANRFFVTELIDFDDRKKGLNPQFKNMVGALLFQ